MKNKASFRIALALLGTILALAAGCSGLSVPGRDQRPSAFGVIADIQYADKDSSGSRYYRNSWGKLDECATNLNARSLAFTIQLGDIIDGHDRDPVKTRQNLESILSVYNRLDGARHVVDNHCFAAGLNLLRQELELKRFYYDFTAPEAKGWRFVVLDGNQGDGGFMGREQLEWFGSVLDLASKNWDRVICFCHYPMIQEAAQVNPPVQFEPVLAIIDHADCVVAWFAGHDHNGSYALRKGVHHVTFQGMLETEAETAYAVVELHPDRILITGFGRVESRELLLERL